LDPLKRPTCEELMAHDYFNDFRDWFEDEIQTLIEYDQLENYSHGVSLVSKIGASKSKAKVHNLSNSPSRDNELQKHSSRGVVG